MAHGTAMHKKHSTMHIHAFTSTLPLSFMESKHLGTYDKLATVAIVNLECHTDQHTTCSCCLHTGLHHNRCLHVLFTYVRSSWSPWESRYHRAPIIEHRSTGRVPIQPTGTIQSAHQRGQSEDSRVCASEIRPYHCFCDSIVITEVC